MTLRPFFVDHANSRIFFLRIAFNKKGTGFGSIQLVVVKLEPIRIGIFKMLESFSHFETIITNQKSNTIQ